MFKFPFGGISPALKPSDLSVANVSTLYANMRASELWLLLNFGVGTAGDNAVISLTQATSNAGANAKVLSVREAWYMRGAPTLTNANASVQELWTKSLLFSREAPAASYPTVTDRGAATNEFFAAIRIRGCDLDVLNGYKAVKAVIGDTGAVSQTCTGVWLSENPRILAPIP